MDSSLITYRWVHCHSIELSIVMQGRMFVNCARRRSTVFQLLSRIGKLIQSINRISVRCVEKDSIRKVNVILLVTNCMVIMVIEPIGTTLIISEPTIGQSCHRFIYCRPDACKSWASGCLCDGIFCAVFFNIFTPTVWRDSCPSALVLLSVMWQLQSCATTRYLFAIVFTKCMVLFRWRN
jgi:hypothetical protein